MKKAKNIFKEFFLLMLILTAITLILAIILYGYSPTNKIVPNKIEYSTPENIKEEINSQANSETSTPITITYELDETQINNSRRSGSYDSGKKNPFAKPEVENTENTQDSEKANGQNNTSNTNNTSGNSTSSTKTNETSYLPSTGGK